MAIFARVIDEGSFRAAAQSLGLAPSRISQTVSDLESHLGVTLLYRTTRKISLTNEGRMFYTRVADMLRIAETGLNELNMLLLEPIGSLRISLPAFMTSSSISTALAEFVRLHPQIKLSVSYSDLPVGLLDDGFDLNIRIGWLNDSSMMSRKLGEQERVLVAGAEYAASRPEPVHPKDIENWDWIKYEQRADNIEFISKNGESVKVAGQYQLQVDNVDALFYFTRQNLGVTVLPLHLADRGLQSGELVQLLPDWKLRPLGCFAVWADTSRRESLTLLLVRFLAEREKPILKML
jgi:DNA-binding transcriptional LysR family regulator